MLVSMLKSPLGNGGGSLPTSAPVNSVLPLLTFSDSFVGTVASVNNGSWSNSPTSYTYQWRRDGSNISGATANTYTLAEADTGTDITARVTAINGIGSTSATSSNSITVEEAPDIVDIFAILGQSNGDGRGIVSSLNSTLATFYNTKRDNLKIYYKPSSRSSGRVPIEHFVDDGEWYTLAPKHDDTTDETSMTVGSSDVATASDTTHGSEIGFGYAWHQVTPDRELRILKIAIGGSTIDGQWEIETDASDDDGIWHYFVNFIWSPATADILAEGKAIGKVNIFWMQGENDTGVSTAPAYEDRLQILVDKCSSDLGLATSDLKIMIGQLAGIGFDSVGATEENWNLVKTSQANIATANSNAQLLITDGTGNYPAYALNSDDLHFSTVGQIDMGYQLYAMSSPVAPKAITDLAVSVSGTTATLSFGKSWGALSYQVQYKLSASPSYTTHATVYAEQASYDITGLTENEDYNFRVVSVNAIGGANSNVVTQNISSGTENPLTDINPNIVIDLTAKYIASYAGTGETWTNIAESTLEPNMWLGTNNTADVTNPTFTGAAGDAGAYFEMGDSGGSKIFTAKSNTTFVNNLHRSDSTQPYTFTMHLRHTSVTNRVIIATANTGTTAGIWVQIATSGHNLRVRAYNSAGGLSNLYTSATSLTTNADNIVSFSFDPVTRAYVANINGTVETGTASSWTNTNAITQPLVLGADIVGANAMDEGMRIYGFAMADVALNSTEITAIHTEMLARAV